MDEAELTNISCRKDFSTPLLVSYPGPVSDITSTLADELGNGGFYSKLHPPPLESYCNFGGPALPVIFSEQRYANISSIYDSILLGGSYKTFSGRELN